MKAVLETASPSGRNAYWWIRVFSSGVKQVTILHWAGRDNVAADALSQNPTNGSMEGNTAVDESQVVTVKSIPPTIPSVEI